MSLARHVLLCLPCMSSAIGVAPSQEWRQFRGPGAQGVVDAPDLPATFGEENVRWRVGFGKGHSSPVLWKDRVYATREGEAAGARQLVALDASTGRELWSFDGEFEPYPAHDFNSYASSTPAVGEEGPYLLWVSGDQLIAHALDHDGEPRWRRRLGAFSAQHGSAQSPVLCGDLLIVANDNEGDESFLAGLDRQSGDVRWRIARPRSDRRASYTVPTVYRRDAGDPVVLFASTPLGVTAVDPRSGELRWELNPGFSARCVAAMGLSDDLLFVSAGTGGSGKECAVVRLPDAHAEEPELVFRPRRNIPYVPSPIALGGRFYLFSDGGIAQCIVASTGERKWQQRLDGTFFSSPVSNGSVIYIAGREGVLFSIAAGDRCEILGTFDVGAPVFATPALAKDAMYLRTRDHLMCLGAVRATARK